MRWAAVIGQPVGHSLSPVLHTAAWRSLGLPESWQYRRIECAADAVGPLLTSLDASCLGLSVTMPCKQAVMPLLDAVDPMAQAVGSVNTIVPAAGVLTGFNTDVLGIQRALETELDPAHPLRKAVILGSGATASSALAALGGLGITDITLAARRFGGPGSAFLAATRLGLSVSQCRWQDHSAVHRAIEASDVVVSTLPAHVCDDLAKSVRARSDQVLLDVIYSPRTTKLLAAWTAQGGKAAHGLDMLLHQAVAQVKLMTGRDPDAAVMRAALDDALQDRAHA